VDTKGERVQLEKLRESTDNLLLYFANSHLKQCAEFLPLVVGAYGKLKARGVKFEVILVSSDREAKDFKTHYAQMPWMALAYSDRVAASELRDRFEVIGLPEIVIVDSKTGNVVTKEGGRELHGDTECAKFPWPAPQPQPLERLSMRYIGSLNRAPFVVALLDGLVDDAKRAEVIAQLETVAKEYFTEGVHSKIRFAICDHSTDGQAAAKSIRNYFHLPDNRPVVKPPDDKAAEYVCSKNHPLHAVDRAYHCDKCGARNRPHGEWHWMCKECDYDACQKCLPPPPPSLYPPSLLFSNIPKKVKHVPKDTPVTGEAARTLAQNYLDLKLKMTPAEAEDSDAKEGEDEFAVDDEEEEEEEDEEEDHTGHAH